MRKFRITYFKCYFYYHFCDSLGSGFHPGEAKGELKKRLVRNKLGGRIVGIETIDRMTDRQIAAKVRRYLQENSDKKGT